MVLLEARLFGARLGGHFGVVNGNELADFHELVLGLLQLGRHLDHRHQPTVLAAELREFPGIAEAARVGERSLDFLSAGERGR